MAKPKDKKVTQRRSQMYNKRFKDGLMRSNTNCTSGWEVYTQQSNWKCSSIKKKKTFRPEIDLQSTTGRAHPVFELNNPIHKKKRKGRHNKKWVNILN